MTKFTHLHCHSYYSLLRGTMNIETLCSHAQALGMKSLALTDVDGLYGWVEFVQCCRDFGLRPLCGVDLRAPDGRAVLLAKNGLGYSRICRLISDKHLDPSFSLKKSLREDRGQLAVLSRDLSLLAEVAESTGSADLHVELLPLEENLPQLRFAREHGLKTVASNDVYFLRPSDHPNHRWLRAIDNNTKLSRLGPADEVVAERRFLCEEEWMRAKLSYAPEAVENAGRLAEELEGNWRLGETVFPPYERFSGPEAYFTLRWKCYQGARRRYGELSEKVRRRIEYELEIIRGKGFSHYFLVVDDIVRQAPRTCGRGSVAASIVSYCLGITHVDPIKHNLFFERFLNPSRRDPPDADIDFPWDERDAILDYIFKKYGPYRAAMVSNHVRLQFPSAVRELAKVYGFSDSQITQVTEKWFRFPPRAYPKPWDEIFAAAGALTEIPQYLSVHAGGVVIVPDDLRNYVPLQPAPKGVNILQWEKDQTEDFGLVKIDILGNRSLAVVRDALGAVESNTGTRIDYAELDPTEDPATQAMLAKGDSIGVFYIESPAMRQLQQKAGVGDYEHIVIHSSIIRPASYRYINEYVERLHGKPWDPLHPLLQEILDESYGLMVYQEDVTKTAMALAGFNAVDGDGLRKALSKKRPEKWLGAYRVNFYAGARERGVGEAVIEAAWRMIESFAGYSFCKPHSASYALVSFQAAYLRAHYPAEFIAAVISNGGGFYSTSAYLSEARRLGLTILPPDINASQKEYRGRDRELRVGLMQLKGVPEKFIERLLEERKARGAYASLEDFLRRVPGDLSDLKILIRAGCFDSLAQGLTRPQLMWKLLQLWRPLREGGGHLPFARPEAWVPAEADYSPARKIEDELETLGLMASRHPMSLYREAIDKVPHVAARCMAEHVGKRIRMVGWLITGKVVSTKRQELMEFMTFEDLTGIYETTFFPASYRRNGPLLNRREPFWVLGRVEDDHGGIALNVDKVEALRI
ncbi:MAG TPA: DNA polymerase III subunit alpha [bacterium]|nr:DNA polymerase III subunit alpha [bacterium]